MAKKIAMFFDGTRNTRPDKTNVLRLYDKVRAVRVAPDQKAQLPWYNEGVGTKVTDWFTGAAFGRGVYQDVRESYEWLRNQYEEGDELYLFGFSRGAFTARSLAGFIAQYGILPESAQLSLKDLYKDYRNPNTAHPIYRLKGAKEDGEELTPLEERLMKQSRIAFIQFLGVWDTVGSLGLSVRGIPYISSDKNRFHVMEPRLAYLKCCHALAVDEFRPHYRPILWKRFVPTKDLNPDGTPPPYQYADRYEQRWFIGAHSNVGGGYKNPSPLYKVSLKWMEERAAAAGLGIANHESLQGDEHLQDINDSFADFLPYKVAFWTKRTPRPIRRAGEKKISKYGTSGVVFTLGESVDATVLDRKTKGGAGGKTYSPVNVP